MYAEGSFAAFHLNRDPLAISLTQEQRKLLFSFYETNQEQQNAVLGRSENQSQDEREFTRLSPGPQLNQKMKAMLTYSLDLAEKLRKSGVNISAIEDFDTSLVQRLQEKTSYPMDDVEEIMFLKNRAIEAQQLFNNPRVHERLVALTREFVTSPKVRNALINKFQKDIESTEKEARAPTNDPANPNFYDYVNGCHDSYTVRLKLALSPAEVNKAKKTAETAVEAIRKNVLPNFSQHSQQVLGELLTKLRFRFPQTQDELGNEFDDHLNNYSKEMANEVGISSAGHFNSICLHDQQAVRPIRDLTELTGQIVVGWESARFPEMGLRVLTHELGHQISGAFQRGNLSQQSTAKFVTVRQCLDRKHASEPSNIHAAFTIGSQKIEDGNYTEEDWADLISSKAVPGPKNNIWCSGSIGTRSLLRYKMASPSGDSHSAMFFRLLQIHQASVGTLPDTCKKALSLGHIDVDFSPCL